MTAVLDARARRSSASSLTPSRAASCARVTAGVYAQLPPRSVWRNYRLVGTQFYVYYLKHAAAEDVAKLINEAFSEGPASEPGPTLGSGSAALGGAPPVPQEEDTGEFAVTGDGGFAAPVGPAAGEASAETGETPPAAPVSSWPIQLFSTKITPASPACASYARYGANDVAASSTSPTNASSSSMLYGSPSGPRRLRKMTSDENAK